MTETERVMDPPWTCREAARDAMVGRSRRDGWPYGTASLGELERLVVDGTSSTTCGSIFRVVCHAVGVAEPVG